ncbi:MAG TPA: hypothetical protein VD772_06910, partial [Anseongella sp.]|nr:hypothetical protein [Anseongella sp.]
FICFAISSSSIFVTVVQADVPPDRRPFRLTGRDQQGSIQQSQFFCCQAIKIEKRTAAAKYHRRLASS